MGNQLPSPKKGQSPQFLAHFYCSQTAGCIKIPLGIAIGLSPGDFVSDGDPAPLPKKGHSPQFLANIRCGQTAGWTKMPLGMEVGLGPGDFVFDGDPVPQWKGAAAPAFRPMFIMTTVARLSYCWALVVIDISASLWADSLHWLLVSNVVTNALCAYLNTWQLLRILKVFEYCLNNQIRLEYLCTIVTVFKYAEICKLELLQ